MTAIEQATIKNTRELKEANKASGTAMTLGNILAITSGLAVDADNGTVKADFLGVCKEDIAVSDAETRVLYLVPSDEDTFIFPTSNNSDADHNNQQMKLANATEVNNTGTTDTDGIVVQVEPYGEASDKKIIGKFLTM